MEWLRLNDEGEIEFVMEEVKLIPEIETILQWAYNKGYKGDTQGRKRLRALAELKYIYLAYSTRSPYKDFSEKERIEEAKKDCEFSNEWVESKELKQAIQKFIKGTENKVTRSLKLVEKFLDKFEDHLLNINLNERTANEGLVHKPSDIMKTLQELPRFLSTLQELEQQARLGIAASPTSKGDHELGWMAMNNKDGKRKLTIVSDSPSISEDSENNEA